MPINRKLQNLFTGLNVKISESGGTAGAIPVLYKIITAAGATNAVDVTLDRQTEVTDVWVILGGGGGNNANKVNISNTATSITADIIVGTAADKDVVRTTSLDDSSYIIPAGGILRATATDSGAADIPALGVYVLGMIRTD
tara:strand:- start:2687 stop:3109 length:423 start_codon:yes stop_codon:yes gene_type:complete